MTAYDHYKTASLSRIVAIADPARSGRSKFRKVADLTWDASTTTFKGRCVGQRGTSVWEPRIVLNPTNRTYGCTCPDHKKQGGCGPCKHIISLAKAALETL
jgi:hypothetical protein